jgi:hypothetical protein
MQVGSWVEENGMMRSKSDCHKHGRGCDEHVVGHGICVWGMVFFWTKYTLHSLKRADQREIAGYIDK